MVSVFYILSAVVALGWIHRYFKVKEISRPQYFIEPNYDQVVGNPPLVSIVIPARNEEVNIGRCLLSIVQQEYKNIEIIVLNDRSTDNTAQIVADIAKSDQRVRLINIDHCPDGWSGKNHALVHGVKHVKGKYLLFTDADTYHYQHCLKAIVLYMMKNKVDLLSINPHLVTKSFWENVIMPVAGGILMIWFPLEKINDNNSPLGYANGQLMVFDINSYKKIGGHEAVKDELLEDLAFARKIKQAGMRLKVLWGPELYQTHMYSSLKQIWNGWVRIFCHGFQKRVLLVMNSLILMAVFSFLPYLLVFTAFFLFRQPLPAITSLGVYFFMIYCISVAYGVAKSNRWYLFLHLLSCLMVSFILLYTGYVIIFKQKISWRGCHYSS
ncbi:MAG: glycosyltransferase family 2 protein [Candidatus Auribacterota bacterium]|jgi:chlorobactene glucosyltransferase|nr:glycosyltransferase family 2 protein [Candidatus Auribacterota bacterium]